MHGSGQSPDYQRAQAKWEQVADTAKFLVVFPGGINNQWDISGTSDINFITAIIDTMHRRYGIDRNRVYLSGFSMGGMDDLPRSHTDRTQNCRLRPGIRLSPVGLQLQQFPSHPHHTRAWRCRRCGHLQQPGQLPQRLDHERSMSRHPTDHPALPCQQTQFHRHPALLGGPAQNDPK